MDLLAAGRTISAGSGYPRGIYVRPHAHNACSTFPIRLVERPQDLLFPSPSAFGSLSSPRGASAPDGPTLKGA